MILLRFLLLSIASNIVLGSSTSLRGKNKQERRIKGRVIRRGGDRRTANNIFQQEQLELELYPEYAPGFNSGTIVTIKGLDSNWAKRKLKPAMDKGRVELTVVGSLNDMDLNVKRGTVPQISSTDARKLWRRWKRPTAKMGTRTVLVIQTVAQDSTTTKSIGEIRADIFGPNSRDSFNLVERFKRCSYGKLILKKFHGKTRGGRRVYGGVTTIRIPMNAKNANDSKLRNAVVNAANKQFGNLEKQFDHVMICLPPGTPEGWQAYAYEDHWLSVYNDRWCNSVSTQVHEIAHNLNLSHSGNAKTQYGDKSGFMGYSYLSDEGPRMCFNAAKSWQLGWYRDKQRAINPLAVTKWRGQIVGISEYKHAKGNQLVTLRLKHRNANYHIGFNRASGMTRGTREARNLITIIKQGRTGQSTLVAKLGAGQSHAIQNYSGSGKTVTIRVHGIVRNRVPWHADVSIAVSRPGRRKPNTSPTGIVTKKVLRRGSTITNLNPSWHPFFLGN